LNKINENEKIDRIDDNVANINITQLEGERRIEDEVKRRQQDMEKIKKLKKSDLPARLDRLNKERSEFIRKDPLILSEPQLTDDDYEHLIKLNKRNIDDRGKYKPTDFLLQDKHRSSTDILPIRTPKPENSILISAREASYLRDPTNGGYERSLKSADISLITKSNKSVITPNPYKAMLEDISIKSNKGNVSVKDDDKLSLSSALKSFKNESYAGVQKSMLEDNWQMLSYQNIESSKKLLKLKKQKVEEIFNKLPAPENHIEVDDEYVNQLLENVKNEFNKHITDHFDLNDIILDGIDEDCKDLLVNIMNCSDSSHNHNDKMRLKTLNDTIEQEIRDIPEMNMIVEELGVKIFEAKFTENSFA